LGYLRIFSVLSLNFKLKPEKNIMKKFMFGAMLVLGTLSFTACENKTSTNDADETVIETDTTSVEVEQTVVETDTTTKTETVETDKK
jgi:hypothetical protein